MRMRIGTPPRRQLPRMTGTDSRNAVCQPFFALPQSLEINGNRTWLWRETDIRPDIFLAPLPVMAVCYEGQDQ